MTNEKIPIIVGVTGHRNIVDDDKDAISDLVKESLEEIKNHCKDTPVVMLNAFAQGADMLCAQAAFDLGIDVYAVLPCPKEQYIKSFDKEKDRDALYDCLARTKRQIIAPDIEKNKAWLKEKIDIDDDSYRYRQLGIYMAEHSHILIALWDGKPPKTQYGCGTVEVIKFALEHSFLDRDHSFRPGVINDSAVVWIKSRREGDKKQEIVKKWIIGNRDKLDTLKMSEINADEAKDDAEYQAKLAQMSEEEKQAEAERRDEEAKKKELENYKLYDAIPEEFLTEIIQKTVKYNAESCSVSERELEKKLWVEKPEGTKLTDEALEARKLDEYRKSVRYHYAKADDLSYGGNQTFYKKLMFALAVLGAFVALFFLLYDDTSTPYFILPCTILIAAAMLVQRHGKQKNYHKNYTEYRTFAEALRIQFYLSMCLNEDETITNVCDLCSWTQKVNIVWIDKALQALSVIHPTTRLNASKDEIMYVWIAKERPQNRKYPEDELEGQRAYHRRKKTDNHEQSEKYNRAKQICQNITLIVYALILALEIVAFVLKLCNISWFWEENILWHISWRNFAAIILGVSAAITLLFSSYWGKLSYDRMETDNENMLHFYSSAYKRWMEVRTHQADEIEMFVTEIAREEIVENGIWCSYVNENRLEINI